LIIGDAEYQVILQSKIKQVSTIARVQAEREAKQLAAQQQNPHPRVAGTSIFSSANKLSVYIPPLASASNSISRQMRLKELNSTLETHADAKQKAIILNDEYDINAGNHQAIIHTLNYTCHKKLDNKVKTRILSRDHNDTHAVAAQGTVG